MTETDPFPTSHGRGLSLEYKVTLLITALLALTLVLAHREVRGAPRRTICVVSWARSMSSRPK